MSLIFWCIRKRYCVNKKNESFGALNDIDCLRILFYTIFVFTQELSRVKWLVCLNPKKHKLNFGDELELVAIPIGVVVPHDTVFPMVSTPETFAPTIAHSLPARWALQCDHTWLLTQCQLRSPSEIITIKFIQKLAVFTKHLKNIFWYFNGRLDDSNT